MADLSQHFEKLRGLFDVYSEVEGKIREFMSKNSQGQDERAELYEEHIENCRRKILRYLDEKLLRFPPYHERHLAKLVDFHKKASYEKCVFIMTKFPDPHSQADADKQLQRIIDMTKECVTNARFVPRLAVDDYHTWLWDNVEIHLLGCCRGIAIVEDRYRPELNPNVAMEWGWMKGMGKPVLFLMEETFQHNRADWHGLIAKRFKWDEPEPGICDAIEAFLS
jgi:hypothetical protein